MVSLVLPAFSVVFTYIVSLDEFPSLCFSEFALLWIICVFGNIQIHLEQSGIDIGSVVLLHPRLLDERFEEMNEFVRLVDKQRERRPRSWYFILGRRRGNP